MVLMGMAGVTMWAIGTIGMLSKSPLTPRTSHHAAYTAIGYRLCTGSILQSAFPTTHPLQAQGAKKVTQLAAARCGKRPAPRRGGGRPPGGRNNNNNNKNTNNNNYY